MYFRNTLRSKLRVCGKTVTEKASRKRIKDDYIDFYLLYLKENVILSYFYIVFPLKIFIINQYVSLFFSSVIVPPSLLLYVNLKFRVFQRYFYKTNFISEKLGSKIYKENKHLIISLNMRSVELFCISCSEKYFFSVEYQREYKNIKWMFLFTFWNKKVVYARPNSPKSFSYTLVAVWNFPKS